MRSESGSPRRTQGTLLPAGGDGAIACGSAHPHLRYAVHPCAPNRAAVREPGGPITTQGAQNLLAKAEELGWVSRYGGLGKGSPHCHLARDVFEIIKAQRITSNRFRAQLRSDEFVGVTTVLRSERVFLRMARP